MPTPKTVLPADTTDQAGDIACWPLRVSAVERAAIEQHCQQFDVPRAAVLRGLVRLGLASASENAGVLAAAILTPASKNGGPR